MKKMGKGAAPGPPPAPTGAAADPPPPASGSTPAPAGTGTPSSALPPSATGFRAVFRAAVTRKFREMTGQKWQDATDTEKRAEATRRATSEVARRIERLTGKRPADSTIRRNAGKNTTPRGADQQLLNRQAAIDRAGGIKQFATQAGVSPKKVSQWRDTGSGIAPGLADEGGAVFVVFDVTCDIFHPASILGKGGTTEYGRRLDNHSHPLYGSDMAVSEPDASSLVAAHADGDDEMTKEVIGRQIEIQVTSTWYGRQPKAVTVTTVHSLEIRD
jgi:hypothetical protein